MPELICHKSVTFHQGRGYLLNRAEQAMSQWVNQMGHTFGRVTCMGHGSQYVVQCLLYCMAMNCQVGLIISYIDVDN